MSEPAKAPEPESAKAASPPWRSVLRVAAIDRASLREAGRHALPWLAWLRRRTRSSELWVIAVATVVGLVAGALAVSLGALAHGAQVAIFNFDPNERLSAQTMVEPWRLLAIPLGGLLLGLFTAAILRFRPNHAGGRAAQHRGRCPQPHRPHRRGGGRADRRV